MPKAIVCIGNTWMEQGQAAVTYTVSILGPPNYSYQSDYIVNTSISVTNNLLAWRSKIISQATEKGVTLTVSDVIIFGGPS